MVSEKKIKITFVFNGLRMGGAEKQFTQQVRYYDKKKFEISLITLMELDNSAELYNLLPKDIPVYRLSFRGRLDFLNWMKLLKLLWSIKPGIVVSSFFFSNTVLRVLKPLAGYVSIPREHNTYTDKTKFQKYFDRVLSNLSYKIVAVSQGVAEFTSRQEGIPISKFEVIYNGIDIQKARDELNVLPGKNIIKREMGFNESDKVIVNIARLTKQKNHKLLIDGFRAFYENHPDYKLLIVGDGSETNNLKEHVEESNAGEYVIFAGIQYNIWKFYKMADVFISTSSIEGFSNAYLEALVARLPLVVTRTAGTAELLKEGKNGFFIDYNVKSIVSALERIEKGELEVADEVDHIVAQFDIKNIVMRYQRLFQKAIHDE